MHSIDVFDDEIALMDTKGAINEHKTRRMERGLGGRSGCVDW